jgi:hypothetical protein
MIDWNSDKQLKTKKAKLEVIEAALAPYLKTPEEQAVLRCPVCGSHNWASAAGIMWCARCKCHCNGTALCGVLVASVTATGIPFGPR